MPELPDVATQFIVSFILFMILGQVVILLATWGGRMATDLYDRIMSLSIWA